ncbi:lysine-specific demethylase 4A isoform X2 [Clarias magur]|uniref:Lysine-specific demethylase 4A isoform X2 n=1 Tax=Clarias magur TaxID=1594786 RepID=A0A8J4UEG7_CLAMG|nr:lysine-specific demethylase 4A isoform X2 [Clarias magur]
MVGTEDQRSLRRAGQKDRSMWFFQAILPALCSVELLVISAQSPCDVAKPPIPEFTKP